MHSLLRFNRVKGNPMGSVGFAIRRPIALFYRFVNITINISGADTRTIFIGRVMAACLVGQPDWKALRSGESLMRFLEYMGSFIRMLITGGEEWYRYKARLPQFRYRFGALQEKRLWI